MEITIFTIIVLILSLVFVLQRRVDYFLYASIFFSGYTGTSVLNIYDFSLQPSFYFVIIYLLIRLFSGKKFSYRLFGLAGVFFVYCAISTVFPLFINNPSLMIMNQEGFYTPVKWSLSNYTQLFYLLFDLLFLNELFVFSKQTNAKIRMVNSFKYGLISVELICIYQIVAFNFNFPFDMLFRQSVHGNIQGTRLYGPCIEASMLCYYLIPAMIIVFQNRKNLWDYLILVVALFIGFLTESSTFLVGTVCLFIYMLPVCIRFLTKVHPLKAWGNVIVGCCLAVITIVALSDKINESIVSLMEKLQLNSFSGQERYESFRQMAIVGLRYPFGVGFGTSRSKDLLSTWLCNIGLIGIIIFLVFTVQIVYRSVKGGGVRFALPYVTVLLLMFLSVPEPYNLFIWYFIFYAVTMEKWPKKCLVSSENKILKEKKVDLKMGANI